MTRATILPAFWLTYSIYTCGMLHTSASAQAAPRQVIVAWDDEDSGDGFLRAIAVEPPWNFSSPPVPVGRRSVIRAANGLLYAVSPMDGTVSVVDPTNWTVSQTYPLGPASQPQDIAVVSPQRAYVTRAQATHLLRLDLPGGTTQNVVDLSIFADADGIPDMSMMAVHENRLFVQLRRIDTDSGFELSAMIAVVDLSTEQIVDADPQTLGVQAVHLAGRAPKFKMQVFPSQDRLIVSATGDFFDAGGIESIDLTTLQSSGLLVAEADDMTGADAGAFVMVDPTRGYLTFSTDFALSSHLVEFTSSGSVGGELYVTLGYFVPTLVADLPTNHLFLPHSGGVENGVHVFDATTGAQLTTNPIPLSGRPSDLALLCDCPTPECGTDLTCASSAPALGTWGLLIFGLLLTISGVSTIVYRMHVQKPARW